MDDIKLQIKTAKQRLIWIDENIHPMHPDIIIYSEEVSELEQEVKNLEIKLKDYETSLNNQKDFYKPRTQEQYEFHNTLKYLDQLMNDPHPRYRGSPLLNLQIRHDPLSPQIEDLIELSKLFGLEEAAITIKKFLLERGNLHNEDFYNKRINYKDNKIVDYFDRSDSIAQTLKNYINDKH